MRIERVGPAAPVEDHAALDLDPELVAQRGKIADRAQMDVRGLVPRVRQEVRHRHPAAQQEVQANPPKAEIRE